MILLSGEAAPGLGPAAEAPFCRARKVPQRGALNTSFHAFCSGASATNPPHDHCFPAPPWPYETRPCRSASARFASLHTSSSRRKPGPIAPVGTGFRRC